MIRITKKMIFSSTGIFILYTLLSFLVIIAFRFFFPPEPPPLLYYSFSWRINQGLVSFFNLFPALALSSLVIPFGYRNVTLTDFDAFSAKFLEQIKGAIITAIIAAALYGLVFFLLLPLALNKEDSMRSGGRLFRLAKERAQEHTANKDWPQAMQFTALCERIWPQSPEMETLRNTVSIGIEEFRLAQGDNLRGAGGRSGILTAYSGLPGQRVPVTAAEALSMANTARREQRYYDAHWLASLAERLARPNSVEAVAAARLAGEVWTQISSQSPNVRETRAWNLYRLKRDGYEAMVSGDWIRAYYIFRDHAALSPGDLDVEHFLPICEQGISEIAFFTDEMELTLGEILTGAVFSLPSETDLGHSGGRVVLRIASLSTFPDFAFGVGIELIAFDREEQFLYRLEAPYAKIVPLTLDTGPRLVLLMRALDRNDQDKRWEPVVTGPKTQLMDQAQLLMVPSYEDFLILSKLRRGLDNLEPQDLFTAANRLGGSGYLPQVFQAEIIYRLCEPVLFLPMTILAILLGWRFRAKARPRYSGIPMLAILPLVFYGLVHFYRGLLNNMAIWTVVSFGYAAALTLFISGTVVFFILSLIALSAQRN